MSAVELRSPETRPEVLLRLLRETSVVTARRLGLGREDAPLAGLCAAVALMAQGVAGGEIIAGAVAGEPHFWNRLPGGVEVDLTGDQFGGDGWAPVAEGRPVPRPDPIPAEHLLFAMAVGDELEGVCR